VLGASGPPHRTQVVDDRWVVRRLVATLGLLFTILPFYVRKSFDCTLAPEQGRPVSKSLLGVAPSMTKEPSKFTDAQGYVLSSHNNVICGVTVVSAHMVITIQVAVIATPWEF
jgi:hypothetical protein